MIVTTDGRSSRAMEVASQATWIDRSELAPDPVDVELQALRTPASSAIPPRVRPTFRAGALGSAPAADRVRLRAAERSVLQGFAVARCSAPLRLAAISFYDPKEISRLRSAGSRGTKAGPQGSALWVAEVAGIVNMVLALAVRCSLVPYAGLG
jgi:hypothetical protein